MRLFLLAIALAASALAQSDAPVIADPVAAAPPVQAPEDKRIFGVIPNNRTTEASLRFEPITSSQKMAIAAKDSFDWPVFPTAGLFAVLHQIQNQNPAFGQGMTGYAQRFATAYGDQMIGNMMTEGIVPSLTREDPRYFRIGEGTRKHRIWYAATRIFVTVTDSGGKTFNFSEWGGNAAAVAISNAYYADARTVSNNVEMLLIQCGTDAFSNVLKEFWPDVKRRLFKKKADPALAVVTP